MATLNDDTDPESRHRMSFRLEVADDWPPFAVETLWVADRGDDLYALDNVPFLARGLALGDIVRGQPDEDGMLWFEAVVERRGHHTLRVVLRDGGVEGDLVAFVIANGGGYERSPWPSMIAIDVPSGVSLAAIRPHLMDLLAENVIGVEEGSEFPAYVGP